MSKYEPTLRELAMEPDEERRLELAAEIDRDAAELDERWENRDGYAALEAERDNVAAERDQAIAERDGWRRKYADRFFDAGDKGAGMTTPSAIASGMKADNARESRPRGYAALWAER